MRNIHPRHLGASVLLILGSASCASAFDPSESIGAAEAAFTAADFGPALPLDGTFTMLALDSKCVDIDTATPVVGSHVVTKNCSGAATQQLRTVEAAPPFQNLFTLRIGDLCLAPQSGVASRGAAI